MARLYVMRHAKSVHVPGVDDHDRDLNERGRRDAPAVGRAAAARGWLPRRVVCSTAVRARRTLEGFIDGSGWSGEIRLDERLYHPTLGSWQAALEQESAADLLVVSHNSGCEDLIAFLTGTSCELTTGNIAAIDLSCPISEAVTRPGSGALLAVLRPKDL
jgi:phosphohistidine phosphatase